MSYLPEINIDVPCNPEDLLSKLEEDLEKQLGEFSNALKNSSIWGNPLITSAITQLIGSVATYISENTIEELINNDLVNDIIEKAQDYISILMTAEAQMKLAAYFLLVENLKNDIKKRREVLVSIYEKLENMEKFIRAWDYYEIAGRELTKLRSAERSMKAAAAKMKRAKQIFETFERFASTSYNSSLSNVSAAAKALERRSKPLEGDLFKYWQQWWDKVQADLVQFAEDSIEILNLLPADQKILNDIFPEWVSIYGLLTLKFAVSPTQTSLDWKWVANQMEQVFKPKKLIPLNSKIRKTVNEIKDLDTTWEDMKKYANQLAGHIEESYNDIKSIQQNMEHDAYIEIPDEVKLSAKNAMYLTQIRLLQTKLLASKEIISEYDDLLSNFIALEALVSECREYPKSGEHPAESIPDLIFSSYESIIFDFFSEGGSRNALVKIGNVKRRINLALGQDSYLLGLCNAFDGLDNALITQALDIYNTNIDDATNLLSQIGNSVAVNALLELDFTGFKDALWPKRSENRCTGKEAVGEPAESRAEMDLKQDQRKLNWTKAMMEKMDFIEDPLRAIKDTLGLDMLGE